ncbi:MAG: ribonuclease H-like domain-containing protein [Leptolinea sp.]
MAKLNESLSEKLHSLGVQVGAVKVLTPSKVKHGIEDVVDGAYLPTSFGDIFCSSIGHGIAYAHGRVTITPPIISTQLALWNKTDSNLTSIDPSTIIFLDTETTGLSGGTGTLPFMVGLGWFSTEGFVTSQLFIRNPAEEPALIAKLDQILTNARAIVTYNGKGFDIPLLNTRYVINGMLSPLKDIPHFDLLPISRRLWKRRLENRGLKDIETEILGYTRSQMEVPGWEIPIIYFDYLRTHDPEPLAGVFYHNAVDILSLAALFIFINQMFESPEIRSDISAVDSLSLAILFEDTGEIENAVALYEMLFNIDLPDVYAAELRLRYGRLLKRNGQFDQAVQIWNQKNGQQDFQVLIQLAKVLEHQRRDYESALQWTILAQEKLNKLSESIPISIFHQLNSDLLKRLERINKKIDKDKAV